MANRCFGGNSGYVGYSMSVRAMQAKSEGRYPAGEFRRNYGVTPKSLEMLVRESFVYDDEYHHTSKFGNKTTFYGWADELSQIIYETNKSRLDSASRKGDMEAFREIINSDEVAKSAETELRKREELSKKRYEAKVAAYAKYQEERAKYEASVIPAEIVHDGIKVLLNGSRFHRDWKYRAAEGEFPREEFTIKRRCAKWYVQDLIKKIPEFPLFRWLYNEVV